MLDWISKLVDAVEGGVARSLDELCREHLSRELDSFPQDELEELDEYLFTCESCGWTMPIEEQAEEEPDGELICRECAEE